MSEPFPSATAVLLRDAGGDIEVLLLRRSRALDFHGGAWVFPGGRVDAHDVGRGAAADGVAAARAAAVRETAEEASLAIEGEALVLWSRWTTPAVRPKRFKTWFFLGVPRDTAVRVDGAEIREHRWLSPRTALVEHGAGHLALPPPTFVTLTGLAEYSSTAEALTAARRREPEVFEPRPQAVPGGFCSLYFPDAGYETENPNAPGPRHRLWMLDSGWRYEREGG